MNEFIALLFVLIYSSLCLADPLTCEIQTEVPAADNGSDQATFALENEKDKVKIYESGRYKSSSEAMWRIVGFFIHERFPTVEHFAVHLENETYYYRPCSDFDRTCVAEYLAAHSNCTLNVGSISEPHYRAQINTYFPNFNMSLVQNGVYISGLNAEIVEFYHNNVIDKLVIAVYYADLNINSTTVRLSYHRTALEPAVTLGSSDEHIINATITVVFDDVSEGLDFSKSYVHAYMPILPETIYPDTLISYPADQNRIDAMMTEFLSNLPVVFQEGMQTKALIYFWIFIQNSLCDFDISDYK